MKSMILALLVSLSLMAGDFTLQSDDIQGELTKVQEFDSGYGCSGENKSPQLHWHGAPKETKSFALTLFDPDAPTGHGWLHWVVVNIPATSTSIASDASAQKKLPKGALETMNDYGMAGFGGACPPKGDKAHRYIFTIYALDIQKLNVTQKSDYKSVKDMINKHTLEKTSFVSYYKR